MSDVYEIQLYPLQDWWKTVEEMLDFVYTGQMGNFIFRTVQYTYVPTALVLQIRPTSLGEKMPGSQS